MTFKRYDLETACVSSCVLTCFTCSFLSKFIWDIPKTYNTMYRGVTSGQEST